MSVFRYRMQNILDIKSKLETQAKNEYAAANMALLEEKEKLNALLGRRAFYENRLREHLQADAMELEKIRDDKIAIRSMDELLRRQYEMVRRAEMILEEKRIIMTELMKERKTQETLKEHAFEEFLAEEKRAESKQIDELTSYVYGMKQKENS